MNISQILRGLLDIVEKNQADDIAIDHANAEMLPVIDTQELSIADAEQEYADEQPCGPTTDCECDDCDDCGDQESDFPELDVIKRNAGMPAMTVITDGSGSVM